LKLLEVPMNSDISGPVGTRNALGVAFQSKHLSVFSLILGRCFQSLDSSIQYKQVKGDATPYDEINAHDETKTFFH
jgi:hypothetical protein